MNTQITAQDIEWLFDVVWPRMEYAALHRDSSLARLGSINRLFAIDADDPDTLLRELVTLDGIGLVIGSGLIFAANRETMIPFDKFTMGWALELRIIPDNRISTPRNYATYCRKIIEYIEQSDHLDDVLSFVLEADAQAQFPFPPE